MDRLPSLLALLLIFAAVGLALRPGVFRPAPGGTEPVEAPPPGPPEATGETLDSTLLDERHCRGAAYLCEGLRARESAQVRRWPDGTRELRIRVSLPEHEDPAVARALQQAAARGIRAWQGQPVALRIETDLRPGLPDIVVTWTPSLEGAELGRVRSHWSEGPSGGVFAVDEFVLATRHPLDPEAPLPPTAVELAAAHEMGHALGLPHSQDPRDLMYASNTAARLSVDDYRAVEALYALPGGAYLMRAPR